MNTKYFRHTALFVSLFLSSLVLSSLKAAPKPEYYELKIYHVQGDQMEMMDAYLKNAYLPAAHRAGIKNVGVFKAMDNDSLLYVLTPFKSLDQLAKLPVMLAKDKTYQADGQAYVQSAFKAPAYTRYETILLEAFDMRPMHRKPDLTGPVEQRVYELRSYESPSEARHMNKVKMFTAGGEVDIFDNLGFNPVFYGRVIAGSRMPNLMYLTTFADQESRDAHWKSFGADANWNKLKVVPEYQDNMNRNHITFIRPTDYSDL